MIIALHGLHIVITPLLKAAVKLTKMKLHGNNVHDVLIVHVINADTLKKKKQQTN